MSILKSFSSFCLQMAIYLSAPAAYIVMSAALLRKDGMDRTGLLLLLS